MKYVVKWTQWFFSGPEGDDFDYEDMSRTFSTGELAEVFIQNLVDGEIMKGTTACSVHLHEITVDVISE